MTATWTVSDGETAMTLRVAGPLRIAGPWEIEPIEGDFVRIVTPTSLYRAWLDARVLRDPQGSIIGLHVDDGRLRNLLFAKEPSR
jgi:D-aminopeptidase